MKGHKLGRKETKKKILVIKKLEGATRNVREVYRRRKSVMEMSLRPGKEVVG